MNRRARLSLEENCAEGSRQLADASSTDRMFVATFRRILDGQRGQKAVVLGLTPRLGFVGAKRVLRSFVQFLEAVSKGQTRQMARHPTDCGCIGEDEGLLADIVRSAASGDAETAASRAAEIVRQSDLTIVLERAAVLGALLEDMDSTPVTGAEARARLH